MIKDKKTFFKRIKTFLIHFFSSLLEIVYPPYCIYCNQVFENRMNKRTGRIHRSILFCHKCRASIISLNKQCPRCGGTKFTIGLKALDCPSCHTRRWKFKRIIAIGEYQESFRDALRRIKTDKTGRFAVHWTKLLLLYHGQELKELNADYIVPAPMFFIRRFYRGVNSPDIIANVLGKYLNVPVANRLVQRYRMVRPQVIVSARKRYTNVKNVFRVRSPRRWFSRKPQYDIKGKTIILVDDILTTGSTCNEISKILLAAGASDIYVVVLARGQGKQKRKEKRIFDKRKMRQY